MRPNLVNTLPTQYIKHTIDNEHFVTQLDFISISDIAVSIIEPEKYRNARICGLHVPWYALKRKDYWYIRDGQLTEKAINRIKSQLAGFHRMHVRFQENLVEIEKGYFAIKLIYYMMYYNEFHGKMYNTSVFLKLKNELRQQMKRRDITSKVYQQKLQVIKKPYEVYRSMWFDIEQHFKNWLDKKFGIFLCSGDFGYFIGSYIEKMPETILI